MQKQKTILALLFSTLFFFVAASLAKGADSPFGLPPGPESVFQGGGSSRVEVEMVADLRVADFTLVAQDKNKLRLSFQIENKLSVQSNLVYELELTRKSGESTIFLDKQVFENEKLTIRENEQITKEVQYQAPEYFQGPGELWLRIKDPSGLTLALGSLVVNFSGSGEYLELASPCYLTIGEASQRYSLGQGVDLKPEERLFLNCQAQNRASRQLEVVPVFSAIRRGVSVSDLPKGDAMPISFSPGERRMIKLELLRPQKPQAYDLATHFEEQGRVLSNKIFSHVVVVGKSATIVSASLDGTEYEKNGRATVSVLLARSADGFPGARHKGTRLEDPNLQIEIKNGQGELCGAIAKQPIGDFIHSNKIEVPIEKACPNPQVALQLKDGTEILDSRFMNVSSEEKKATNNNRDLQMVFITLSGLLLMIVLIWQRRRKMIANKIWPDSKKTFLLLIFFLLSSLAFASEASAGACILTEYDFYRETVNTPYLLGYGVDPVDLFHCSRATLDDLKSGGWIQEEPITIGGVTFDYLSHSTTPNEYYFCGVMQASFTDSLNKGSYNKQDSSDDIILTGEAQGLKTCTNGINSAIIEKTPYIGNANYTKPDDDLSSYEWLLGEAGPVLMTDLMEPTTFSKTYDISLFDVGDNQMVKFYVGYEHAGKWNLAPIIFTRYFDVVDDPVECDFTAELSADPASGSAPLTVNVEVDIASNFGGFSYSSFSCGSGGSISNTDTDDGSFTCTYTTAGTYTPSLKVTQYAGGENACSQTPRTTVTVTKGFVINGACGTAMRTYGATDTSWGSYSFCSAGTANPLSPDFPTPGGSTTWKCDGSGGGTSASCTATRSGGTGTNGACGTAMRTYGAADTSWGSYSFCSAGTVNPLSPNFPGQGGSTTWICEGSGGGTSASCIATRSSGTGINGACGTAKRNYLATDTSWGSYSFCSAGTANPLSPDFPTPGGSTTWKCDGSGGGTSASCTATRSGGTGINGACGTAQRNYTATDTSWGSYSFCSAGTANPLSPDFPTPGGSTTWKCDGSGGGTSASCRATRSSGSPEETGWALHIKARPALGNPPLTAVLSTSWTRLDPNVFTTARMVEQDCGAEGVEPIIDNSVFRCTYSEVGVYYPSVTYESNAGDRKTASTIVEVTNAPINDDCSWSVYWRVNPTGSTFQVGETIQVELYVYSGFSVDDFELSNQSCGSTSVNPVITGNTSFTCTYDKNGAYFIFATAKKEGGCANDVSPYPVLIKGAANTSERRVCKPDDVNCAARTCKNRYCWNGCELIKGTSADCD